MGDPFQPSADVTGCPEGGESGNNVGVFALLGSRPFPLLLLFFFLFLFHLEFELIFGPELARERKAKGTIG